jgi:hypothetical protein
VNIPAFEYLVLWYGHCAVCKDAADEAWHTGSEHVCEDAGLQFALNQFGAQGFHLSGVLGTSHIVLERIRGMVEISDPEPPKPRKLGLGEGEELAGN